MINQNFYIADAFAALPLNTAVVCHDAGAANVIIWGLKQTLRRDWRFCMQGPAALLLKNAFGDSASSMSLEQALSGSGFLLSGTGWASSLEHNARALAVKARMPSAALLDHWVNYPMRFERGGEIVLSDEIWVTDEHALNFAQECFPDRRLILVDNWYLKAQLSEISSFRHKCEPELLYLAEPVRSNWGLKLPGEFQALDYFVSKLPMLGLPQGVRIRLRPHPSEESGKYDDWIRAQSQMLFVLDRTPSLAASLARAKWVAGCESFGLALALASGRSVFCSLPPWAPQCRLPQTGLIHLAALDG
jgi:hypothetical protein